MAITISSRPSDIYHPVPEVLKHSDSTLALRILKSIPVGALSSNMADIVDEANQLGPITKEYKSELLTAYLRYLSETISYLGNERIGNIFKKNLTDADSLLTQKLIEAAYDPNFKKRRNAFEAFVDLCCCIGGYSKKERLTAAKEFFLDATDNCSDLIIKSRIYRFLLKGGIYSGTLNVEDRKEVGNRLVEIAPHLPYKHLMKACKRLISCAAQNEKTRTVALDLALTATLKEPLVDFKTFYHLTGATTFFRPLTQSEKSQFLEIMDKDFGPLIIPKLFLTLNSFDYLKHSLENLFFFFKEPVEKEIFCEKRAKMAYHHLKEFVETILEHKNELKLEYNWYVFNSILEFYKLCFPVNKDKNVINPFQELFLGLLNHLKNGLALELNEKQELKEYEAFHFNPFAKSNQNLETKYFFDPSMPRYNYERDMDSINTVCEAKSKRKEKAVYSTSLAEEDEGNYFFALKMLSQHHSVGYENLNIQPILETICVAGEYTKRINDEGSRKFLKYKALEFYLSSMYSAFLYSNSQPLHEIAKTLIKVFEFSENDRLLFEECIYRSTKGNKHTFPPISVAVKDILVLWKALDVDQKGFNSFIPNIIKVAQKISCPLNQVFGFYQPVCEFEGTGYPFSLFFGNNFAEYINSPEFTLPQVLEMGALMLQTPLLTKNQIVDILSVLPKIEKTKECELKPFLKFLSALSPHLKVHNDISKPFFPQIFSILKNKIMLPDGSVMRQANVFDGIGLDFINGISNIYTLPALAKNYFGEKSPEEVLLLQTEIEANIVKAYIERLRNVIWYGLTPVEINAYLKLFRPFVENLIISGLESNLINEAKENWNKLLNDVLQWHHKLTKPMKLEKLNKKLHEKSS